MAQKDHAAITLVVGEAQIDGDICNEERSVLVRIAGRFVITSDALQLPWHSSVNRADQIRKITGLTIPVKRPDKLPESRTGQRQLLLFGSFNADRDDLFTEAGLVYLSKAAVIEADYFVLDQLTVEWHVFKQESDEADRRLAAFAREAPAKEDEARVIPDTIPGVGPVIMDVVVSELGDVRRLRPLKKVRA